MIGFGMDGNVMGGPGNFGDSAMGAYGQGLTNSAFAEMQEREKERNLAMGILDNAVRSHVLGVDETGQPVQGNGHHGYLGTETTLGPNQDSFAPFDPQNPVNALVKYDPFMDKVTKNYMGLTNKLAAAPVGSTNVLGATVTGQYGPTGPGLGVAGQPNMSAYDTALEAAISKSLINSPLGIGTYDFYNAIKSMASTDPALKEMYGIKTWAAPTISSFTDDDTPYGYQGGVFGPLMGNIPLGVNPLSPILDILDNIELQEYKDNPNPALPGVQNFINRTVFSQDNNVEPSIELIDPIDITPSTNPEAKAILDAFGIENQTPTNQQEVDALMDDVLGQQSIFDGISVDPLDLSMAMASVEDNPWGYNQSVIDALNTSFDTGALSGAGGDPRLAEAKRLAEQRAAEAMIQRAAEAMIARQARQVTPVEQRNPSDKVTIPVSSGPDIVIDVTPPPPAPKLTGKQAANEPRNPSDAPIRIAAKSIARPKAFKALPKFAQKEIRQGKVPTGGSDYMQDMIREFLNPRDSSYRKSKPVYARMDDR